MSVLNAWLRLTRLPNLLIMALTFYLIRWSVALAYAHEYQVDLILSNSNFLLLVLVTALTAAGGNIVNDIYDQQIDSINKPGKTTVGSVISERTAWVAFSAFNALALLLILFLWLTTDWFLIWMYPFGFGLTFSMLWLYSSRFKKEAFIGNFIVSLFVSFVPLSICYPELVNMLLGRIPKSHFFLYTSILYIAFAFLSNFLREIIKDLEDREGDAQFGGNTLPIKFGSERAVQIATVFGILLFMLIVFAIIQLVSKQLVWSSVFALLGILVPNAYIILKLRAAQEKEDFHHLSTVSKSFMLMGLMALPVLHIELNLV